MNKYKHKHTFEVVRSIWSYADGWGIRCKTKGCRVVLDTGLDKNAAKAICEQQNFYEKEKQK